MGLLDFNLPGMDTAEGQGLLAASLSLMGATKMPGQKGAFGQAMAGAGQQYMQTRGDAQNQMDNREVKRLQSIVNDGNTHAQRTFETLSNVTEGGANMRVVAL